MYVTCVKCDSTLVCIHYVILIVIVTPIAAIMDCEKDIARQHTSSAELAEIVSYKGEQKIEFILWASIRKSSKTEYDHYKK